MQNQPAQSLDLLLGRIDRVRTLARTLVRDGASADDLVQEALLRAIRRPTTVTGDATSWIRSVLGNLARDGSRSQQRRKGREETSAQEEPTDGGLQSVVSAERHKELAEAVLGLEEPYRTAITLRHFDNLPPRAIAERTGHSVEAVKKHLSRGLVMLRSKLEARYGPDGAWAVALLPIVGTDVLKGSSLAAAGTGGGWAMPRIAMGLLAVLVIGGGTYALWPGGGAENSDQNTSSIERGPIEMNGLASREEALLVSKDQAPLEANQGTPQRSSIETQLPITTGDQQAQPIPDQDQPFVGRLVDLRGRPVPFTNMLWQGPERESEGPNRIEIQSDNSGVFAPQGKTEKDLRRGTWSEASESQGIVFEGRDLGNPGAMTFVLCPQARLSGIIQDEQGAPIEGASVYQTIDLVSLPGFPLKVKGSTPTQKVLQPTDASGTFNQGLQPAVAAFPIRVEAAGYKWARFILPEDATGNLVWTLHKEKPGSNRDRIQGLVTDLGGGPVGNLRVHVGQFSTQTDPAGLFDLSINHWSGVVDYPVTAIAKDGRFVTVPMPSKETVQSADGAELLRLAIPASLGSIKGQVVDSDGSPIAGMTVYILNGTRQGSSSSTLEKRSTSDPEGRFETLNMQQRPYNLKIVQSKTLLTVDLRDVWPGEETLKVRIPKDAFRAQIQGEVFDYFGDPLPGVQVTLSASTITSASIGASVVGPTTLADESGHFEFRNVPWRGLSLGIKSRPHDSTSYGKDQSWSLEDLLSAMQGDTLQLKVNPYCEALVQAPPGGEGLHSQLRIEFQDAMQAPIFFVERTSTMSIFSNRAELDAQGHSKKLMVPQNATNVVLFSNDKQIMQKPIRLSATEVNRLEF